jgi:hypothetical protein
VTRPGRSRHGWRRTAARPESPRGPPVAGEAAGEWRLGVGRAPTHAQSRGRRGLGTAEWEDSRCRLHPSPRPPQYRSARRPSSGESPACCWNLMTICVRVSMVTADRPTHRHLGPPAVDHRLEDPIPGRAARTSVRPRLRCGTRRRHRRRLGVLAPAGTRPVDPIIYVMTEGLGIIASAPARRRTGQKWVAIRNTRRSWVMS